jgi:hypothetical protein
MGLFILNLPTIFLVNFPVACQLWSAPQFPGCHDDWANPQLDTVTLRPAPSDSVMICPLSCCGLKTQIQLHD